MTRDEAIQIAVEEYFCSTNAVDAESAFLASLAASGFAVVPVEATDEMAAAAVGSRLTRHLAAKAIYAAMVAAAQKEQG
jgi:hypothetical protein